MRSIILSALSGCLIGFIFCFPSFSFLAWLALVPFFYIFKKTPFFTGLLSSAIFAFCYYGVAMFWITHVTIAGYTALMFYLCLYGMVFFLLAHYFFNRPFSMFTVSCAWVVVELFKEHLWPQCGWAHLGYSQFQYLPVIQVADIGGVKLISWMIVMFNVFVVEAIWYIERKQKNSHQQKLLLLKAATLVLFAFFCFFYSSYRMRTLSSDDEINVSVIQPNIPEAFKYNQVMSPLVVDSLRFLGKKAKEGVLAVYPEAAWPFVVEDRDELKTLVATTKNNTLIGVVETRGGKYYNSALYFSKDGKLLNDYHKIKLVPYGEYVPLRRFLRFIDAVNDIGDMSPGSKLVFFDYQKNKFSVLICFEDNFPFLARQAAQNSDFLVNITNDGWFYGEPEASQHFAVMTLRAVENRISIIRSANTGISGWVSFKGEATHMIRNNSKLFFPGVETFSLALNKQRSFYTKYGEAFSLSCLVFLGIFFITYRRW